MSFILTLIIFLPLFNFFVLFFWSLNNNAVFAMQKFYFITTGNILIIFFCSLYLFSNYLIKGIIYQLNYGLWFDTGGIIVKWSFLFDHLTISMLFIVTLISFFVHLYSIEYLHGDPFLHKFFSYISLFTFFMLILITSNNYLQLFLGWEGVGLCSFLLISFWNTRIQAYKSAVKAMLINRIGDFFLLMGVGCIFYLFRTVDFLKVFQLLNYVDNIIIFKKLCFLDLICFFLFVGAVGKSAQIGLHTWLPDAMEGPTPVSALIHAATMVTAGVFLLIRCSHIIELSDITLILIVFFGGITAFFSATVSLFQHDIKKIIAYSTCSQLGYMFLSCGFSLYNVALYHLITHAFFKALLFLAAGSIIHSLLDEQNLKKMGGLSRLLPITYAALLIGTAAITGFPFFSGFYSKDLILEQVYLTVMENSFLSYLFLIITAFFTVIYSLQIVYWSFLTKSNISRQKYLFITESNNFITFVLFNLSVLSIFAGYCLFDIFGGNASPFLGNSIYILPSLAEQLKLENIIVNQVKNIPLFFGVFGLLLVFLIYNKFYVFCIFFKYRCYIFLLFFIKKWHFDLIYNYIGRYVFSASYAEVYQVIDKGFLEYLGPRGVVNSCFLFSQLLLNSKKLTFFGLLTFLCFNFAVLLVLISIFFVL